ncbi:MAG: hypothetical protein K5776_01085 [Lachnospiraceae bacterium]|nr:hypothetical protein [Lachnospiraceae bacterium]
MYKIIAIAGLLVRQFLLPNPFSHFGLMGEIYNLLASSAIGPLAYFTVGRFYSKGEAPALGSILYLITYMVYTFEIWLVLKPYPNCWLVSLFCVLLIVIDIVVIRFISNNTVG